MRGVWEGRSPLAGSVLASSRDGTAAIGRDLRAGGGRWERSLSIPAGGTVLERGLLTDGPPGLVIQWALDEAPTSRDPVRLLLQFDGSPDALDRPGDPGEDSSGRLEVLLEAESVATVALLPREAPGETRLTAAALAARERLRATRSWAGRTPFLLRVDGREVPEVRAALRFLDDAPFGMEAGGSPRLPFALRALRGSPELLEGEAMARLGRVALRAGRFPISLVALRDARSASRANESNPPPGILALAADWVAWSGKAETTGPLGERSAGRPLPRSDLSDYAPWLSLDEGSRALPDALRALPVWVDGTLGIRPDARYGRLTLGPLIDGDWTALEARGLALGDNSIGLEIRRGDRSTTVRVYQEGGKVPVNVVFRPRIRGWRVDRVRIGGAEAEVDVHQDGEEAQIRCQFPLDPERTVEVTGRPS